METKTKINHRKYEKSIGLDIPYSESSATQIKNIIESGFLDKYAFVDREKKPNDDIKQVHTSHEIDVQNKNGKIEIKLVFRHRGSSIRYNNESIISDCYNALGLPMPVQEPPATKAKVRKDKSKALENLQFNKPFNIPDDQESSVGTPEEEINEAVPVKYRNIKIPTGTAECYLDTPELEIAEPEPEPEHDPDDENEHENTYAEYQLYKLSQIQKAKPIQKPKPKTKPRDEETEETNDEKPWYSKINGDSILAFCVGVALHKILAGAANGSSSLDFSNQSYVLPNNSGLPKI